jgi:hypothetical protein
VPDIFENVPKNLENVPQLRSGSVFPGRGTEMLFKTGIEIRDISKSGHKGHLIDGIFTLPQKISSMAQSQQANVFTWITVRNGLKLSV